MDKILEKLYYGEICPEEQFINNIEECKIIRKKHLERYESFIDKLSNPLQEEFKQIMDEQLDYLPFESKQMFIEGFKLGTKIIIAVFDEKYKKLKE